MILQNHMSVAQLYVTILLERGVHMKCRFCNQRAGVLKGYHDECKANAEKTMKQIEGIVNQHKSDETVPKDLVNQLKEVALSNKLYVNYLESEIFDKTLIQKGETLIYVESMMRISESKNRCKMIETGHRYEKMPTWSEKEILLDDSGRVVFTDKAVYLFVGIKAMRYPYSKIVNYGLDKIWSLNYAYFDVKTSSPYPHRFTFTDTFKDKKASKEQNIALFLHSLV